MEIRRILLRKETKFVTLLLTSMLIATASAAVYYSLFMEPKVTVTSAVVQLVAGDDWPGGTIDTNNGTYARLTLNAYPNVTLTYEEPLNVSNTDSSDHQFRLRNLGISTNDANDVSNFTKIAFIILDTSNNTQASLNYTDVNGDDTWEYAPAAGYTSWLTLPLNTAWVIRIEITAASQANTGIWADIDIAVDVKE